VLMARALAYGQMRQHDLALADLARYLARTPNDAAGLSVLGMMHDGAGRSDLAIAAYGRALAVQPDYGDAYFNRALAFAHAGRMKEGRADIDRYIAMRPNDAEGYALRAATFETDAPAAARADLAKAHALGLKTRGCPA